jgi:asparagine synthase (glutamine-hydrolysing)
MVSREGIDGAVLEAMNETLVHRGPDSGGVFLDTITGLAARRLAIIDLEGGDQPIANEDGTIHVVQNGEIYNYRELRQELERKGHRFTTHPTPRSSCTFTRSAARTLPKRCAGCCDRDLGTRRNGRWCSRATVTASTALLPRHGRRGLVRVELRPSCASRASLARSIPTVWRRTLAFSCIPAPLTIFREVRKLPAGNVLRLEGGRRGQGRALCAAEEAPIAEARSESEEELAEELRERLRDLSART